MTNQRNTSPAKDWERKREMVFTQWMYLLLLQNAVTFITGFVLAAAQCNHFALCPFLSLHFCLYCFLALLFLSALTWTGIMWKPSTRHLLNLLMLTMSNYSDPFPRGWFKWKINRNTGYDGHLDLLNLKDNAYLIKPTLLIFSVSKEQYMKHQGWTFLF